MSNQHKRKIGLFILLLVFLIGAAWAVWHWMTFGRYHQSTDDAYVAGNLVNVTPQVAGNVKAVYADETASVKSGQLLVALDDSDARLLFVRDEQQLAQTVRSVAGLFQSAAAADALVEQRKMELERAKSDLARRSAVSDARAVSGEDVEHARMAAATAAATLVAAEKNRDAARAAVQGTTPMSHPAVLSAESALRLAWLALQRTQVRAPVDGVVAKRAVQVGEHVEMDTPLMALVPSRQIWLEANFKENQLQKIRIGQPVEAVADLYGSAVVFHGRVVGLGAGTGNVFSLLPAQNATGNWIKVVQRLPVRISLQGDELDRHPLQLGLSTTVTVDTHDQVSGKPVLSDSDHPLYQTSVLTLDMQPVERDIQRIVRQNLQP